MIRQRSQNAAGFSLLEVMIALAILAFGILTIAVAQVSSVQMNSKAKNLSQAAYLAQAQLDQFMAQPKGSLFFTVPLVNFMDPTNPVAVTNPSGPPNSVTTFTRSWSVTPNSPLAGLTTITVRVQWDTPTQLSHDIVIQAVKNTL